MSDDFSTWQRALQRYLELCEQYAEAKAELENLDNVKPTIIAQAQKASGEESVAAQSREAYCSQEYRNWCAEVFAATRKFEWIRLRVKAAEVWFDFVRSQEASRRKEMELER